MGRCSDTQECNPSELLIYAIKIGKTKNTMYNKKQNTYVIYIPIYI